MCGCVWAKFREKMRSQMGALLTCGKRRNFMCSALLLPSFQIREFFKSHEFTF